MRIHGETLVDSQGEAARLAAEGGLVAVGSHDAPPVHSPPPAPVGLELLRRHELSNSTAEALTN